MVSGDLIMRFKIATCLWTLACYIALCGCWLLGRHHERDGYCLRCGLKKEHWSKWGIGS
jgi:hypothetical protein